MSIVDPDLHATGVSESRRLEFHSPYACSKGAADQYVRDYAQPFTLLVIADLLGVPEADHDAFRAELQPEERKSRRRGSSPGQMAHKPLEFLYPAPVNPNYNFQYNSLADDFWLNGGEQPCVVARQRFGRIAIANSDAGAYAYTDCAIDHGHRAAQELLAG